MSKTTALLVLCAAAALAGCGSEPQPSDFQVGMSREEIVAKFGEPDARQSLVKSDSHVWGPIEQFWSSARSGARIEIWSYHASDGRVELYFADGSPTVQGMGFAPQDVDF